jgi:hypothetical protein
VGIGKAVEHDDLGCLEGMPTEQSGIALQVGRGDTRLHPRGTRDFDTIHLIPRTWRSCELVTIRPRNAVVKHNGQHFNASDSGLCDYGLISYLTMYVWQGAAYDG